MRNRVRRIHFVGIGGAGMSGIAQVLHHDGYQVSGSDVAASSTTQRLAQLGIPVAIGHRPEQALGCDVVVRSTAVSPDNSEIVAARAAGIPVVPRAEMLAELMRLRTGIAVAGTHGKTTTTSLIASVLAQAGLDPTFVIGGRLNSTSASAHLGQGEYLVAEADESDGSFLSLQPVMAVVTNIDLDHMSAYNGDPRKLRAAFLEFLHHLPFWGLAVLCADDPVVASIKAELSKPLVTYGIEREATYRAVDIRQQGTVTSFRALLPAGEALDLCINLAGRHNVANALAAIAVALEAGVPTAAIEAGLANFQGIARRFEVHGELPLRGANGDKSAGQGTALLVDDYAHHPRELSATLQAARAAWPDRRLVAVFQPHRYTRTRDLLDDFALELSAVDLLLLTEVYGAGESPIAGADGRALARAIRARGAVEPIFVPGIDRLEQALDRVLQADDVLLVLGAGSIGALAGALVERITPGRPQ